MPRLRCRSPWIAQPREHMAGIHVISLRQLACRHGRTPASSPQPTRAASSPLSRQTESIHPPVVDTIVKTSATAGRPAQTRSIGLAPRQLARRFRQLVPRGCCRPTVPSRARSAPPANRLAIGVVGDCDCAAINYRLLGSMVRRREASRRHNLQKNRKIGQRLVRRAVGTKCASAGSATPVQTRTLRQRR